MQPFFHRHDALVGGWHDVYLEAWQTCSHSLRHMAGASLKENRQALSKPTHDIVDKWMELR